MTHRIYDPNPQASGPRIIMLHPASTTPEQFAALVGDMPGLHPIYPEADEALRWDHLGDDDALWLKTIPANYIAGYSSGAFMAFRMLQERQFRAAMILAGGLITPYQSKWRYRCPLLLCHGTADANVPYVGKTRQYAAGMNAALILRRLMRITDTIKHTSIPPGPRADGCSAYYDSWGSDLRLYTVTNGGHTWPGTTWRDPLGRLGKTCMDFSLTTVTTEWFNEHP